MRRTALLLVGLAGLLLGPAAEAVAYDWGEPRRWVPDLAVGWSFVGCGLAGWWRRPGSRTGPLMAAVGLTWFLGNFASVDVTALAWLSSHALYLHRGLLVHCVLSFPSGRLASWPDRAMVTVAYLAAVPILARDELVTTALGVLLVGVAVRGYATAFGPARRQRLLVVRASVAVGAVFAGGALARTAFTADGDAVALLAYEVVLCAIAVGLLIGLLGTAGERAEVTDLVVELAESPSGTLRDALAAALGDPSLQVGYRLAGSGEYVDAHGRAFPLPPAGSRRAVTPIEVDGRPIGVLVHEPAVLDDPGLLASIRSATRLAAANARLQAEVRAQVAEVAASRRRLVEAADAERRRLEDRLRNGAGRRLAALADRLAVGRSLATGGEMPALLAQADRQLGRTVEDLDELARGLHPRILDDTGLAGALADLTGHSRVPIELDVAVGELPRQVAAAAYFVCSEGLANLAKHAHATAGSITAAVRDGSLVVDIADNGVGGADAHAGSGLRGLADRVEALGGRLTVTSAAQAGTRLTAELPLDGESEGRASRSW
jgi:signal transduction histidine kinase